MEKRLEQRKPLRMNVIFEDEFKEGIVTLTAHNMSLSGLFIEGDIPIRVGTRLFLSFTPPGKKGLCRVVGEVMRVDKSAGMGVRFIGLAPTLIHEFKKYLEGL